MRVNGYPPGAQHAFVVGQVLAETDVIVIGAQDPQVVRDYRMTPAETIEEAFAIATHKLGERFNVLIVPHALQTLIRFADPK